MDDVEKNILRRRRVDLAESVEVTKELVQDLKNSGLISYETISSIEQEKSNAAKMDRIIDVIIALGPPDGFQNFCRLVSRSSRTLSSDLEAELGLERGDIQPRPEMIQEAAALVARKFGHSRRFSETDRREVTELIAAKLQLAHDEWRREADKVQTKLNNVREQTRLMDERSLTVAGMLSEFVRKYEPQILNYSRDPSQAKDVLSRIKGVERGGEGGKSQNGGGLVEDGEEDTLACLQSNMRNFFKEVEAILDHRDGLYDEKERCLRLLKVKDDKVQLDDVIGKITGLSITANMGVEKKDTIIARLTKEIEGLGREADEYEETLVSYQRQLANKEREIAALRHNVHID